MQGKKTRRILVVLATVGLAVALTAGGWLVHRRGASDAFFPPVEYETGRAPHFVDAGDLTSDGVLDLVVPNCHSDELYIFPGNGTGGYGEPTALPLDRGPTWVHVDRIDGDLHLDVVAACYKGHVVDVLWGRGDGSFAHEAIPMGDDSEPHAAVVADLDRDGLPDLAVANGGTDEVVVLRGDGRRGFSVQHSVEVGEQPYSLMVVDVSGDGWLDLVTGNFVSGDVSVALADGLGGFRPTEHYATGEAPNLVDHGDLDGDGAVDIVVANCGSSTVSVLINDGRGAFTKAADVPTPRDTTGVAVVDLDGDPYEDLIVLSGKRSQALMYAGGPGLTFEEVGHVPTGDGPCHFLFEDLNGDGLRDLVVPAMGGHSLSVHLARPPDPVPGTPVPSPPAP